MTATCTSCERPVPGNEYGCAACAVRASRHLDDITQLAGPARDVAHGQSRRGPAVAGGHASGLPLNLRAGARLDVVTTRITGWARAIHDDRGGQYGTGDPLEVAARYLAGHVEWLRHQRYAPEAYRDFEAAARVLRGIVDGPAERRWLGQCGAPSDDGPCRTDIIAPAGANIARCRTCGHEVVVADRRADNEDMARGYSYTAAEISEAYPQIRADRIRQWAHRGRIIASGEVDGRPVYDLGHVLDLAAQEAARLATEQARRARRKAEKTDDESEAA